MIRTGKSPGPGLALSGGAATIAACQAKDAPFPGILRVSGDRADQPMIEALQKGYSAVSGVAFRNSLHGPESALAGVYTGTADMAFMPREIREPMERMAFQWALLVRPLVISYACSAIHSEGESVQLGIHVNQDNPIAQLSLADLDAIFGAEHLRARGNVRRWGQLGLSGAFADIGVRPIVTSVDHVGPLFFRRLVMKDSRKWNADIAQMAASTALDHVRKHSGGVALLPAALGSDRDTGTRLVPIAAEPGEAAVLPVRETIHDGRYPLLRTREVVVHHAKDAPLRAELAGFLNFLLGDEAQSIIDRSGRALPLGIAAVTAQKARLP